MATGRPYIAEYDTLTKPCAICGREFGLREQRFQSRAKFERRIHCSKACADEGLARAKGDNSDPEVFWSRFADRDPSKCWEWPLRRTHNGYGAVSVRGIAKRAHRHAYELAVGPIPEGMMILHACDNRPCCNPAHLSVGTALENNRQAVSRGRIRGVSLSAQDKQAIRNSPLTIAKLAEQYGCSWTTIWRARNPQRGRSVSPINGSANS